MVEGVAASEALEGRRRCKRATHHIHSLKTKVLELSSMRRHSFAFVFGETRSVTIISPGVQILLNKEPGLAGRLVSLTDELAAGL
jgi:hypothetical protein